MLTHIQIKDFAIVKSLDLELLDQLTVITGETGAGKSIMIDALSLAMGARADAGSVRAGAAKAEIAASFDLSANPAAQAWLEARDLGNEECLLRRVVTKEGRSRGYINGVASPIQALKELGVMLVAIHGQHEHQLLLNKDTHRRLLDEFAGLREQQLQVAQKYKDWQKLQQQLDNLRAQSKELSDRADLLRFQTNELELLAPQPGELEALNQDHKRLANVDAIALNGQQVLQGLQDGDGNALDLCRRLHQQLLKLTEQDESTAEISAMVESAQIQLEEAGDHLQRYLEQLEMDPQQLQQLDQRLASYHQLARKHRCPPETLAELWQQLQQELDQLDGSDEKLAELTVACDAAEAEYLSSAQKLSQARAKGLQPLNRSISEKIQPMGMPGAEFKGVLKSLPNPSPQGLEQVEFQVKTNPGQPFKPLNKVASGGELSRISLAIQVSCRQNSEASTLIFDEVDVGIGGAVAEIVGKLLRELGSQTQVLCVTHLPQVAANGHCHLYVDKTRKGNSTETRIQALGDEQVEQEIARMLGGVEMTDQGLAHAKEILKNSKVVN